MHIPLNIVAKLMYSSLKNTLSLWLKALASSLQNNCILIALTLAQLIQIRSHNNNFPINNLIKRLNQEQLKLVFNFWSSKFNKHFWCSNPLTFVLRPNINRYIRKHSLWRWWRNLKHFHRYICRNLKFFNNF